MSADKDSGRIMIFSLTDFFCLEKFASNDDSIGIGSHNRSYFLELISRIKCEIKFIELPVLYSSGRDERDERLDFRGIVG